MGARKNKNTNTLTTHKKTFKHTKTKPLQMEGVKIKGIKEKKMWAVFAPDGYLQVRSISDTKKLSQQMIHKFEDKTWSDYAAAGYTTNKILVDIKLLD